MTNYQAYLLSRILDYLDNEDITEETYKELKRAIVHGDPEANYKGHPKMDTNPIKTPISWILDTRAHNILKADHSVFWPMNHTGTKYLNDLAGKPLMDLYKLKGIGRRTFTLIREALDKHNLPYII